MYLARNLHENAGQSLDEGEFLDVVRMPLSKAVEMVMENGIFDAKTQIALLKTARLLEQEK
jgi:ADP-ribose pyrophosphatase